MKKKLLIAIGYPLGAMEPNENGQEYKIRIGSEELVLNSIYYLTWCMFVGVADTNDVYNYICEEYSITMTTDNFNRIIEQLINKNLLILINEDLNAMFKQIKSHAIVKQGTGVGFNPKTSKYTIIAEKTIEVDLITYILWSNSDGYQDIEIEFNKFLADSNIELEKALDIYIVSILSLYENGLIFFNR